MINRVFDLLASIAAIGFVTALVLPGRQTPQVIGATFSGLSQFSQTNITGRR